MNVYDEIKRDFQVMPNGVKEVKSLDNRFYSAIIKDDSFYGVAIGNPNDILIAENFANVSLISRNIYIKNSGEKIGVLMLVSTKFDLKEEFAIICSQFLELGVNNVSRLSIVSDPISWWNNWKTLMGNAISEKTVYDVLGELHVYRKLLKDGTSGIEWSGPEGKSHDFETENAHFEVKSTLMKYEMCITVSGQYQLQKGKKLFLVHVRFEKSNEGESINDLVSSISDYDANIDEIEKKLFALGYRAGASSRCEKYKIIDSNIFRISDDFPQITPASFIDGIIPKHITKIKYTIDLNGLDSDAFLEEGSVYEI